LHVVLLHDPVHIQGIDLPAAVAPAKCPILGEVIYVCKVKLQGTHVAMQGGVLHIRDVEK